MKNHENWQPGVTGLLLIALLWTIFPAGNVYAQESRTISLAKVPQQNTIAPSLLAAFGKKAETAKTAEECIEEVTGAIRDRYYFANVEFTTPAARLAQFTDARASKLPGATVITTIDRFADIFVESRNVLQQLARRPGVVRIEGEFEVCVPKPPKMKESPLPSRDASDEIVRGGFENLKGKGVKIAIVDTGVDFRHPDFIKYDDKGQPTSRILYLWDTQLEFQKGRGSAAPLNYPNKVSIGTLFNKEQLTAELRANGKNIPPTDVDGHGTMCASIAAGNGNADSRETKLYKQNEVVGVAPEADIIAVRLGYAGLENAYLLNAIYEWLDNIDKNNPLVISGSFGSHWDGHDGQSIEERQLNTRFPLNKAGRAIVFAAGNEGIKPIHASVSFSNKASAKWIGWEAKVNGSPMNIYFDKPNAQDVVIEYKVAGKVSLVRGMTEYNKITKQAKIELALPAGSGEFRFYTVSGKPMKADLYLPGVSRYYGYVATFTSKSANFNGLVGSPGTMENAITVGSYDWNNNFHSGGSIRPLLSRGCMGSDGNLMKILIKEISCYSSPGPTRDGRKKPDIGAPGQFYSSSVAKDENGQPFKDENGDTYLQLDSTGNYGLMDGTSAATPYTAGIIALMFEKKPTLTLSEIKTLFRTKSSKDKFTGNPPTDYWGSGKLDMDAVRKIFAAL